MRDDILARLQQATTETAESIQAAKSYLDLLTQPTAPDNFDEFALVAFVQEGVKAKRLLAGNAHAGEGADLPYNQLEMLIIRGDQSLQRLLNSDQGLVASIAKRYIGRGPSFIDLIAYGNQGLTHYYEEHAKTAWQAGLSQRQSWFVRQAISDALASHENEQRLRPIMERGPTDVEVALKLGLLTPEEMVLIHLFWHGGPDLEPAIARKLVDAIVQVRTDKRLRHHRSIWVDQCNPHQTKRKRAN